MRGVHSKVSYSYVTCVAVLEQGLDETPLTYVDTLDGLKSLAQALSAVREVAVDLEAHSFRYGPHFTHCLFSPLTLCLGALCRF